jgi:outer membrane protein OmpA-like peptidoglycan-associated protein
MMRTLLALFLSLGTMAWLTPGSCVAQTTDSNPSSQQAPAVTGSANPNATPVDPQVAVPDAKNGQDPYGRPVQPVAPTETQAPPPVAPTEQQEFTQSVQDVHFDLNRAELRSEDQAKLQQSAEWLKAHPDVLFTIAGEADPRGDVVYNLYLSDRRALATRDALVKMGVPAQQILFAEGWGKLYPVCQQDDESCWSQERRAHLEPWTGTAALTHVAAASGVQ